MARFIKFTQFQSMSGPCNSWPGPPPGVHLIAGPTRLPLDRLLGDVNGLFQGKTVVGGSFDDPFHIATAHQLGDHVGLAFVLQNHTHESWAVALGEEGRGRSAHR